MPIALRIVLAVVGIVVGAFAPRNRHGGLMALAALLCAMIGGGFLLTRQPEIWAMAAGWAGLVLVSMLLARALPRIAILGVLGLTLAIAVMTLTPNLLAVRIAAGVVALAILVLGTIRVRFGVRIAWAVVGTSMIWGFGFLVTSRWLWGATALALLLVSWLISPREEPEPPRWKKSFVAAAIPAAALALFALSVPWWANEIDVPAGGPQATRLERLSESAPRGGVVWALPSEAILWGETDFPRVENLDALYLGGRADGGTVRLPGTSRLRGRFNVNGEIHDLRMIKDEFEVDRLRVACRATVDAVLATLPLYEDEGTEAAVAASIQDHYNRSGCEGDSFPPIVGGGANGVEPHYQENASPLTRDDLVVTDVGCYVDHYACDFTRTLPVGGKFTTHTRQLYEAVFAAQQAAAEACAPGRFLLGRKERDGQKSLHAIARATLEEHGVSPDMGHGVGHTIGLFVHDVFKRSLQLEPGMVVTIEPGLYLEDEGIGIRIEDSYVVTEDGCESLTTGFPADADSVEALMAGLPATEDDGAATDEATDAAPDHEPES